MTPEEAKIFSIFFPYAAKRQFALEKEGTPLVHYTSAEAAMSIISKREVWMRESSCMNDSSEVKHGLKCVISAYNGKNGETLKNLLSDIFPGITEEIEKLFNGWMQHIDVNTYLSCFSEHDEKKENATGRLSMWRAYSQRTGVALVMNNPVFFQESDYFSGLYTSAVAYLDDTGFAEEIARIVEQININKEIVKKLDKDHVVSAIFRSLLFASLCTKHPGFEEEKEWRLTYVPTFESTPNLKRDFVCINGIPQIIYKIPLKNVPDAGLFGLEIDELIRRIIIGPTSYPLAMYKAFVSLLGQAGVKEPEKRVVISGIPLR